VIYIYSWGGQPIGMGKEIRDLADRKKDTLILRKTEAGKAVKRVYSTGSNSTRGEYGTEAPFKSKRAFLVDRDKSSQ